MNLRTRITVAVVTTVAVATLAVGSLAIVGFRTSNISELDGQLRTVLEQVGSAVGDPVSEAILAVDESRVPLALGFSAQGIDTVWLRELPVAKVPAPSTDVLKRAILEPITISSEYRVATALLPDGEYLVVAAALTAVNREARNATLRLLLLWLPFNAASAAFVSFFVARNVRQLERLVAAASSIAAGAADVEIPASGRSSEARELAAALDQLVLSLQHALATEREMNQRMQEFLGDASHELRTPLTVIKGYLELLERPDGLPEDQRDRAMDRMRSEAARMEMLVNDILLLAEIGSPRDEDLTEVDLTGLVRVLVDDLRALQPDRVITTNISSDITTFGVPSHVHRAIANAIINIRRHTPPEAPVHVDLHANEQWVFLTIEDGGPGLSPDHYARGISHFQRFDKSRSRSSGGSGLGMSIIAAVVEQLGGTVKLRTSSLGGLALDFTLPRERPAHTMNA